MPVSGLQRLGGAAAVIGGLMWVVKSGVILAGGAQPATLFEAAPLAFAVALLALQALLAGAGGMLALAGRLVAILTGLAAILNLGDAIVGLGQIPSTMSRAIDVIAGLGPLLALLLIGWAGRAVARAGPRPGPLELAALYGAAALLLGAIAAAPDLAEATIERLIEIPILIVGLGWVALGSGLIREGRATAAIPAV